MEQEEKLCDEVETVRELTYLGDMVCAGEGCEAAVTDRTRCGWVKCGELLYGMRFPIKLKGAVCYVRPAILYGSEVWCLNERWDFTKDRDPWWEQCGVEYSSKTQ